MKNRTLNLLALLIIMSATTMAQTQFSIERYVTQTGDTLLYRQLEPQKIDANTEYPLVLFLHGAGERGNDNEAQLLHGAYMFTNPVNRDKYPAFALFPQCPTDSFWAPIIQALQKVKPFSLTMLI